MASAIIASLWAPLNAAEAPLSFTKLGGSSVSLDELRKGTSSGAVLLVTWCAECPSCRLVERNIERLAQDYKGQLQVVVVDVNAHDDSAAIRKFLSKNGLNLRVVLDEPGGLVERYNVMTTTTAFLYDSEGQLRYHGGFQLKKDEYARHAVAQLLNKEKVDPQDTAEVGCTFAHRHKVSAR